MNLIATTTLKSGLIADLALAQAVMARDRKATAEFVQRYSDALVRYIRSRLQPRWEDVDDIVQDTFLTALRSLGNYRGESPLQSWLFGIARHKVEDYYRERLRRLAIPDQDNEPSADCSPEIRLEQENNRQRTERVLRDLPEHYRVILLWRYWEQRSTAEMAMQTGRTQKGVERLLARAREEFGKRWRSMETEAAR